MIRGIVWDVGNVLLRIDIPKGVQLLAEKYDRPFQEVWEFVTASPEFHEFERGNMFYDEFVEACNRRFRGTIDTATFARILESQMLGPNTPVLRVRDELPRRMLTVTASNVNSVHENKVRRDFPDVFRGVRVTGASHIMRCRKGDPVFWTKLLERINARQASRRQRRIAFNELVFVDDIQVNLDEACGHGVHTAHFDHQNPYAAMRLREQLAKLGLPIKQIAVANDDVGEGSALSA